MSGKLSFLPTLQVTIEHVLLAYLLTRQSNSLFLSLEKTASSGKLTNGQSQKNWRASISLISNRLVFLQVENTLPLVSRTLRVHPTRINVVCIWETETFNLKWKLSLDSDSAIPAVFTMESTCHSCNLDGSLFAFAGSGNDAVMVWDLVDRRFLHEIHIGSLLSLDTQGNSQRVQILSNWISWAKLILLQSCPVMGISYL